MRPVEEILAISKAALAVLAKNKCDIYEGITVCTTMLIFLQRKQDESSKTNPNRN